MTLRSLQPESLDALSSAAAYARTRVDPELLTVIDDRIAWLVRGADSPALPSDDRARDVAAVLEQELLDVAALDDDTVRRASQHFEPGQFSDLMTCAYLHEALARLDVASERFFGGLR